MILMAKGGTRDHAGRKVTMGPVTRDAAIDTWDAAGVALRACDPCDQATLARRIIRDAQRVRRFLLRQGGR